MLTMVHPQSLDLDTCAREPIHIPGAIQPHGILLALQEPELRIIQASVNARNLVNGKLQSVVNQPLAKIIGAPQAEQLQSKFSKINANDRVVHLGTLPLSWNGQTNHRFDVLMHRHDGVLILELESNAREIGELDDFPSRVIEFLVGLERRLTPNEICDFAAREIQRVSGFDRVLIYRFDSQWHGIVMAEARNENLPSYMGHRFPAADIPAQARELYRLNRSRIIPNAAYSPVPLEPDINPLTSKPLDLTYSSLRSVSPVHVEYMRNMGTASSMSFSIVRDGKLWGLVSCHHATPRWAPFSQRRACELIAQVLSLQLTAGERQSNIEQRLHLRQYVSRLLASMAEADDFVEGLVNRPDDLLAMVDASGAAIVTQDVCRLVGNTPNVKQVREIAEWLGTRFPRQQVVRIDDLPEQFSAAMEYKTVASGLLAVSVSPATKSFVIWFRPEVVETVVWAGDPYTKLTPLANGALPERLNPRTSFEAWREVVQGTAAPWTDAEVSTVTDLHADAAGIVLRKAEAMAALTAELQRSNRELEAFSYSVSHDLRAPFRHIVGYAELLRDLEADHLSERGQRYAGIVIDAARDAGRLIDNLLAFSQMGRSSIRPISIDLNLLMREVQQEVMNAEGAGRTIRWNSATLPHAWADLAMLRLALRNLLSNAVKYTRDRGDQAEIEIHGEERDNEVAIFVRDNGVGFDMRYADKLFGVFQRLHRMEEFEGTGIGLANVRRIVERHGGRVWAEGKVGEGATFGLALPKPARDST